MLALRQSPNVRNAELSRVTQKYALVLAKHAYQPQYSLEGDHTKTLTSHASNSSSYTASPSVSLLLPTGTSITTTANASFSDNAYTPSATLSITQPLIRGFGPKITLAPLATAFDNERINKLGLKNTLIEEVATILTLYRGVVLASNNLIARQNALKIAKQNYNNQKTLVAAGKYARSTIIAVEVELEKHHVSLLQAENDFRKAKVELLNQLGMEPNWEFDISNTIDVEPLKLPALEQCIHLAMENNVSYQASLINHEIKKRTLFSAENDALPKLDLTMTSTATKRTAGTAGNTNSTIALKFDIPIDNKSLKNSIISSKISLQQSEIILANEKRKLEINVANAYRDLELQYRTLLIAIKALKLENKNLEVVDIRSRLGKISTYEKLDEYRRREEQELELINTKISYLNAIVAFEKLLGLTLERWKIDVDFYDRQSHV